MLECVPNLSEGRDAEVVERLRVAGGDAVLDVHRDPDHHRCVLTLVGRSPAHTAAAMRAVALAASGSIDLSGHTGVHPRMGALDVVAFVALGGSDPRLATVAALDFGEWIAGELAVPVFYYDDADPAARTLPETRRDAFSSRPPDAGPPEPHPRLGAVAVGARRPMVAVNVELGGGDVALARAVAAVVRERDGGMRGVRALGLLLESRGRAQVSMNLVDLRSTGLEAACTAVRAHVEAAGSSVAGVELVGLVPRDEYERCTPAFLEWSGITEDRTIEARLGR